MTEKNENRDVRARASMNTSIISIRHLCKEYLNVTPLKLLRCINFLIALTTASSSAAFGVNMECCEKDLGIDRRFVQLKISMEAVAVTIALNVILEFITTAVNLFCLQAELVELAAGLDMLDVKKLREKKNI